MGCDQAPCHDLQVGILQYWISVGFRHFDQLPANCSSLWEIDTACTNHSAVKTRKPVPLCSRECTHHMVNLTRLLGSPEPTRSRPWEHTDILQAPLLLPSAPNLCSKSLGSWT
jgi:hypothetical protein